MGRDCTVWTTNFEYIRDKFTFLTECKRLFFLNFIENGSQIAGPLDDCDFLRINVIFNWMLDEQFSFCKHIFPCEMCAKKKNNTRKWKQSEYQKFELLRRLDLFHRILRLSKIHLSPLLNYYSSTWNRMNCIMIDSFVSIENSVFCGLMKWKAKWVKM